MTKILKAELQNGKASIALEFKWQDLWIGVFWKRKDSFQHLWVCLFPCLPIHIQFHVENICFLVGHQWRLIDGSVHEARVCTRCGKPQVLGVDRT